MAKKTPNGVIPSGPQAHTAQVASTAGDASSFVESTKKFFSGIVDTDMSSVRGAYERYKSGGYKIPNSTKSAPTSGTGTGESSPSNTPSQPDNPVKSTPGVESSKTTSTQSAGSESDKDVSVPSIDFFKMLNLKEFDPYTAKTNEDNYGAFMPIILRNSNVFENHTNAEGSQLKPFMIKLPWSVSEISDTVSVNYNRKFGGETTFAQTAISKIVSGINEMGWIDDKTREDVTTWLMASYNASSLNKTLQLDFVLPITSIPQGRENDFVTALRIALGTLQGLVYPRTYGFVYPPMVKVTCGGIYQNFKGFVESVRLTFSEVMIPVGEYMLPSVINGSISFKNIFMYTWDSGEILNSNGGATEFSLSAYPQVLFGVGQKYYRISSDKMVKETGNSLYTNRNVYNNPSNFDGTVDNIDEYYAGNADYAKQRYWDELYKKREAEQSRLSITGKTVKNLQPLTDKSLLPDGLSYQQLFYYNNTAPSNLSSFNNWFSENITNTSSIFTYGKPMTLSNVLSTITHNTVTNVLSDVYIGNYNVGTFLGRYVERVIGNLQGQGSLSGTLADIATNTVRDIGGVYYLGGVAIGQILGSVLNRTTTTNANNNSSNRINR